MHSPSQSSDSALQELSNSQLLAQSNDNNNDGSEKQSEQAATEIDFNKFKKIMYSGKGNSSMTTKVNTKMQSKRKYLPENVLLNALDQNNVSVRQLIDASLKRVKPEAYMPIEKRFEDMEAFTRHVEKKLQSQAVKNLQGIVDNLDTKNYGINAHRRKRRFKQSQSPPPISIHHQPTPLLLSLVKEESTKNQNQTPMLKNETIQQHFKGGKAKRNRRVSLATTDHPNSSHIQPAGTMPSSLQFDSSARAQQYMLGLTTNNNGVMRSQKEADKGPLANQKHQHMEQMLGTRTELTESSVSHQMNQTITEEHEQQTGSHMEKPSRFDLNLDQINNQTNSSLLAPSSINILQQSPTTSQKKDETSLNKFGIQDTFSTPKIALDYSAKHQSSKNAKKEQPIESKKDEQEILTDSRLDFANAVKHHHHPHQNISALVKNNPLSPGATPMALLLNQQSNLNQSPSHQIITAARKSGSLSPFLSKERLEQQINNQRAISQNQKVIDEHRHQVRLLRKIDNEFSDQLILIYQRYNMEDRYGKVITIDPADMQTLSEKGYRIKAERFKIKRDSNVQLLERQSALSGEKRRAVRGEEGYQSESSASSSDHSSVSFGGVPEADLEHVLNKEKMVEIQDRRQLRRQQKWERIFEDAVVSSVKAEIASGIDKFKQKQREAKLEQLSLKRINSNSAIDPHSPGLNLSQLSIAKDEGGCSPAPSQNAALIISKRGSVNEKNSNPMAPVNEESIENETNRQNQLSEEDQKYQSASFMGNNDDLDGSKRNLKDAAMAKIATIEETKFDHSVRDENFSSRAANDNSKLRDESQASCLIQRDELDKMATHLHSIFEEAIDEDGEIYNASILQNRQVSSDAQLNQQEKPDLNEIEQNYSTIVNEIMQELQNDPKGVEELENYLLQNSQENNNTDQHSKSKQESLTGQNKPSYLRDQASYISQKSQLQERLTYLSRHTSTQPKFSNDTKQQKLIDTRCQKLFRGKVDSILGGINKDDQSLLLHLHHAKNSQQAKNQHNQMSTSLFKGSKLMDQRMMFQQHSHHQDSTNQKNFEQIFVQNQQNLDHQIPNQQQPLSVQSANLTKEFHHQNPNPNHQSSSQQRQQHIVHSMVHHYHNQQNNKGGEKASYVDLRSTEQQNVEQSAIDGSQAAGGIGLSQAKSQESLQPMVLPARLKHVHTEKILPLLSSSQESLRGREAATLRLNDKGEGKLAGNNSRVVAAGQDTTNDLLGRQNNKNPQNANRMTTNQSPPAMKRSGLVKNIRGLVQQLVSMRHIPRTPVNRVAMTNEATMDKMSEFNQQKVREETNHYRRVVKLTKRDKLRSLPPSLSNTNHQNSITQQTALNINNMNGAGKNDIVSPEKSKQNLEANRLKECLMVNQGSQVNSSSQQVQIPLIESRSQLKRHISSQEENGRMCRCNGMELHTHVIFETKKSKTRIQLSPKDDQKVVGTHHRTTSRHLVNASDLERQMRQILPKNTEDDHEDDLSENSPSRQQQDQSRLNSVQRQEKLAEQNGREMLQNGQTLVAINLNESLQSKQSIQGKMKMELSIVDKNAKTDLLVQKESNEQEPNRHQISNLQPNVQLQTISSQLNTVQNTIQKQTEQQLQATSSAVKSQQAEDQKQNNTDQNEFIAVQSQELTQIEVEQKNKQQVNEMQRKAQPKKLDRSIKEEFDGFAHSSSDQNNKTLMSMLIDKAQGQEKYDMSNRDLIADMSGPNSRNPKSNPKKSSHKRGGGARSNQNTTSKSGDKNDSSPKGKTPVDPSMNQTFKMINRQQEKGSTAIVFFKKDSLEQVEMVHHSNNRQLIPKQVRSNGFEVMLSQSSPPKKTTQKQQKLLKVENANESKQDGHQNNLKAGAGMIPNDMDATTPNNLAVDNDKGKVKITNLNFEVSSEGGRIVSDSHTNNTKTVRSQATTIQNLQQIMQPAMGGQGQGQNFHQQAAQAQAHQKKRAKKESKNSVIRSNDRGQGHNVLGQKSMAATVTNQNAPLMLQPPQLISINTSAKENPAQQTTSNKDSVSLKKSNLFFDLGEDKNGAVDHPHNASSKYATAEGGQQIVTAGAATLAAGMLTPMYERDSLKKRKASFLKNGSKQKSQLAKNSNPTSLHIKFQLERSAMGRHHKQSDETIVPLVREGGQNANTPHHAASSSTGNIGEGRDLELQKELIQKRIEDEKSDKNSLKNNINFGATTNTPDNKPSQKQNLKEVQARLLVQQERSILENKAKKSAVGEQQPSSQSHSQSPHSSLQKRTGGFIKGPQQIQSQQNVLNQATKEHQHRQKVLQHTEHVLTEERTSTRDSRLQETQNDFIEVMDCAYSNKHNANSSENDRNEDGTDSSQEGFGGEYFDQNGKKRQQAHMNLINLNADEIPKVKIVDALQQGLGRQGENCAASKLAFKPQKVLRQRNRNSNRERLLTNIIDAQRTPFGLFSGQIHQQRFENNQHQHQPQNHQMVQQSLAQQHAPHHLASMQRLNEHQQAYWSQSTYVVRNEEKYNGSVGSDEKDDQNNRNEDQDYQQRGNNNQDGRGIGIGSLNDRDLRIEKIKSTQVSPKTNKNNDQIGGVPKAAVQGIRGSEDGNNNGNQPTTLQKVKSAATLSDFNKPSNLNIEQEKEVENLNQQPSEKEVEIMRESQFTEDKSPTTQFRLEGKINFDSAVNSTLFQANTTKGIESSKNQAGNTTASGEAFKLYLNTGTKFDKIREQDHLSGRKQAARNNKNMIQPQSNFSMVLSRKDRLSVDPKIQKVKQSALEFVEMQKAGLNSGRNGGDKGVPRDFLTLGDQIKEMENFKDQNKRYASSVRRRKNPYIEQATSMTTQKYLSSRRRASSYAFNPMAGQKISIAKPMGGGFKIGISSTIEESNEMFEDDKKTVFNPSMMSQKQQSNRESNLDGILAINSPFDASKQTPKVLHENSESLLQKQLGLEKQFSNILSMKGFNEEQQKRNRSQLRKETNQNPFVVPLSQQQDQIKKMFVSTTSKIDKNLPSILPNTTTIINNQSTFLKDNNIDRSVAVLHSTFHQTDKSVNIYPGIQLSSPQHANNNKDLRQPKHYDVTPLSNVQSTVENNQMQLSQEEDSVSQNFANFAQNGKLVTNVSKSNLLLNDAAQYSQISPSDNSPSQRSPYNNNRLSPRNDMQHQNLLKQRHSPTLSPQGSNSKVQTAESAMLLSPGGFKGSKKKTVKQIVNLKQSRQKKFEGAPMMHGQTSDATIMLNADKDSLKYLSKKFSLADVVKNNQTIQTKTAKTSDAQVGETTLNSQENILNLEPQNGKHPNDTLLQKPIIFQQNMLEIQQNSATEQRATNQLDSNGRVVDPQIGAATAAASGIFGSDQQPRQLQIQQDQTLMLNGGGGSIQLLDGMVRDNKNLSEVSVQYPQNVNYNILINNSQSEINQKLQKDVVDQQSREEFQSTTQNPPPMPLNLNVTPTSEQANAFYSRMNKIDGDGGDKESFTAKQNVPFSSKNQYSNINSNLLLPHFDKTQLQQQQQYQSSIHSPREVQQNKSSALFDLQNSKSSQNNHDFSHKYRRKVTTWGVADQKSNNISGLQDFRLVDDGAAALQRILGEKTIKNSQKEQNQADSIITFNECGTVNDTGIDLAIGGKAQTVLVRERVNQPKKERIRQVDLQAKIGSQNNNAKVQLQGL